MGRINEFLLIPVEYPEGGRACRRGEDTRGDASGSGTGDPPLLEVRGLVFSHGGDGRGRRSGASPSTRGRGRCSGWWSHRRRKSTLIPCSPDHPAPPGSVFLEGIDPSTIPLPDLRRRFAVVSRPVPLLGTILGRMFGLERADPEAAGKATGLARFLAEVEEMSDGFDTVVGERGIPSRGGRSSALPSRGPCAPKRRSAAGRRPSAVDAGTERKIFEGILAEKGERTSCSAHTGLPPSHGATGSS